MPRTRLRRPGADLVLSAGILAAAAGALALSGFVSAPAGSQNQDAAKPAAGGAMRPAADAHPDSTGHVHLVDYTDNDGPDSSVILTGAIGDYGTAVSVNPDGSVNPEHNSQLRLELSRGSFRLDVAALDRAFVAAFAARFPADAGTCSGDVTVSRAVPIVPGSGTGAYQGVSGAFQLTITADEVDPVGSDCDGTAGYLSQKLVTTGFGGVRLR